LKKEWRLEAVGRPVVLSNGQLFVGLDEKGLVHDFYYPYVGLDNLTNARSSQHKIGVWVDGVFRWTNDDSWQVSVDFDENVMISDIRMHSDELAITLQFYDFVDTEYNALVRCIKITNEAENRRDIRLFMHQVFQISRAGRADTAMYVPDDNYVLDYKGRCCLLIAGKVMNDGEFDQYSVGNYAMEGKAGTFMDAEDGELSGNAVEHGGVDSVIRFRREVEPHDSFRVDYWVVAADSQSDAQQVHAHLKYFPLENRLKAVREHWQKWLKPDEMTLENLSDAQRNEVKKSLLIIKAHCDERGSILASGDSSIFNYGRDYYCYCWPRDAAFAVWPLIRLGKFEEAKKFFDFARDTRHRDGYLMHKYQPDRAIGSTWHPLLHGRSKELAIQEDETASVIFMIGEYFRASKDQAYIENIFDSFINPCANFLSNFVDGATGLPHASYDLWEQKFLTSTYTVCTIIAALETAAQLADMLERSQADAVHWRHASATMHSNLNAFYHPDGYFRKGFLLQADGSLQFDDTLDISNLYGPYMFAKLSLDDTRLVSTAKHVEERLYNTSPIGGVIRFEHDDYFLAKKQYKGNPWVVCTLWLAQYLHSTNQPEKAQELVAWALARAHQSGALSEQFDPETGFALGVTPLVWSHSEMINTLLDIADTAKP
jgi:GH15 family glucan-1,4-alpha-glucosidase